MLKCLSASERPEGPAPAAPFPLGVFPAGLRKFVQENAAALPCPPDYIGLGVLAVACSFIGPDRPLRVKPGWEERAVLYAATVGETGTRKSPAMDKAMAPAWDRDRRLAAEHKDAVRAWRARRDKARAERKDFDEPEPVECQHVTSDSTVEGLADVLTNNPRGVLFYRDELTGWVAALNQYKGGKGSDRQFWLSAWSCQDYTINRRGKPPQKIASPYLPVVGNIPPDMLGELADRGGRREGFVDRILFAYPDPVPVRWTDASPDPRWEAAYVNACRRIGGLPPEVLCLTDEARGVFAAWYDGHNSESDGPAGSWAKMDGYCVRLANILHHLSWAYAAAAKDPEALKESSPSQVGPESVRGAVALIDYFKDHARRALGRVTTAGEEKELGRLLKYVASVPDGKVRPRFLISAQVAKTAAEARRMLQQLADLGLGEMVRGGRKDEVYFQGFADAKPADPESS